MRDSLRQALNLVRKALSGVREQPLIAHEDSITLIPTALNVDAIALEDLVEQQRPESLQEAVGLYRGDLLDGFQVSAPEFESWATVERQRLRERALEAMAKLLDCYLATARSTWHSTAMRVLAAEPLHGASIAPMELYRRQGRYGALRQYRTCPTVEGVGDRARRADKASPRHSARVEPTAARSFERGCFGCTGARQ